MSVLKNKRRESQFEVIKHFYRLRKDITDLLLRDFGYNQKKSEKKMNLSIIIILGLEIIIKL